MPKYYVNCGSFKVVITREHPKEAAKAVLEGFGLGRIPTAYIYVSETGYNHKDNTFQSDELMREIHEDRL